MIPGPALAPCDGLQKADFRAMQRNIGQMPKVWMHSAFVFVCRQVARAIIRLILGARKPPRTS